MNQWHTNRPTGGQTGLIYAEPDNLAARLCAALIEHLDQGDGWSWNETDYRYSWLFGRMQADLQWVLPSDAECEVIRCDIIVVENTNSLDDSAIAYLNELNAHSSGWFYWHDVVAASIVSSSQIRVTQPEWWWAQFIFQSLPKQVTCADAAADRLAKVTGGNVAVRSHPERGLRPSIDGWLIGERLGPRDMAASLDLFTSELDLQLMETCLYDLFDLQLSTLGAPLAAAIADENGNIRWDFRRFWNPDGGWAWQWVTVDGAPADIDASAEALLESSAARRNSEIGASLGRTSSIELGGWVAFPNLGLVHVTSIESMAGEQILNASGGTAGTVLAVAWHQLMKSVSDDGTYASPEETDRALSYLRSVGPIAWSYLLPEHEQPMYAEVEWTEGTMWCIPRHSLAAYWGIFNPMGPTISSLELTYAGDRVLIWWLLRHPLSPRISLLDVVNGGLGDQQTWEQVQLVISRSLSETDSNLSILGSGPEFFDVVEAGYYSSIIEGLRAFGRQVHTEEKLRMLAEHLCSQASDPWIRIRSGPPEVLSTDGDAVDKWCSALLNSEVIAGHQLFMRSAWEGAKVVVDEDGFEKAQKISDRLVFEARERALADFTIRGHTPPLVLSAVGSSLLQEDEDK